MKSNITDKAWVMSASATIIFVSSIRGLLYGCIDRQDKINRMLYEYSINLLNIVKARLNISGKENIRIKSNKKYIVMSNHSSHYDIFILFYLFGGNIRMIAKKELFKIPLLGRAMRAANTIPLDRKNVKHAIQNLEYAKKILNEHNVIWISPEGGRKKKHEKKNLKKGGFIMAIQSDAIIIPIFISGSDKILPANTWDFATNQEVNVKILPEIETSKFTIKNISKLMDLVFEAWQDANVN
ncbi:MAG: 1-acyl-sn-glycerol-3-phosphate acyltransferase [Legionellales bacterium]|nr:1-acyl-sn-glycerol-3-phosphate acyltransferase [Legionellales bacterium]